MTLLQWPKQPQRMRMGAPPKAGNYYCPKHPNEDLEWIACTGNSNFSRKSMEQPCNRISSKIQEKRSNLLALALDEQTHETTIKLKNAVNRKVMKSL